MELGNQPGRCLGRGAPGGRNGKCKGPGGGVCLTSCRNSKEASAARSKERVRQGPEPAGPWGLDNPTEHLESVSSFQMYLKDRHHVNVLCSF